MNEKGFIQYIPFVMIVIVIICMLMFAISLIGFLIFMPESAYTVCKEKNGVYVVSECVINSLTYNIVEVNNCYPAFFNYDCSYEIVPYATKKLGVDIQ